MKPRQKIRSVLRKYQKLPNARPALLGNGAGLVEDSKNPGHNYVRIANSPAISVVNHRTAPVNNQKVWVGYDPLEPDILQVLSIRSIESFAWGGANPFTVVVKHATSHRWFERDTVFVDLRQMMPFRPQVNGTMIMQVYHGVAYIGNQWQAMLDSSIDLTSYIPTTGTVYALIYYDTNGDLAVKSSITKDLNSLIPSDAPSPIINTIPIALVRLWSGMSGIVENRTATDMADVRWMGLFGGGGGGGGGGGNVTPNIPSTTYWPDGWNPSDVAPYYNLPFSPLGLKAVNTFVTGSSSNYLYGFLTWSPGLQSTQIVEGDWVFDSWFNSQNKDARVYCYVYKRDAGGTETELFNFDYCTLPGLSGQREFIKTVTQPAFNIDPTDRLLVKYYGTDPQNFGYISMWTGINNTTITVPGFYTSSGTSSGNEDKIKVSSSDILADYLEDKLNAGSGIIFTKNNPGANETITISSTGTLATSSVAGLVPPIPGNANLFLNGTLNWTSPFPTTNYSEINVSNPPTNAEISAAFGDPSVVVEGYLGIINDGGLGLREYLCGSDGTYWWVMPLAKAYVAPDTNLTVLALDTFTDTDGESL